MATVLGFVPIVLSLVVLGAHFLRGGHEAVVAVIAALLALAFVRRRWAARVVQAALLLGVVEWLRTLFTLAALRSAAGQPVVRLVVILGTVALVTALSAWLFETRPLRRWHAGPEAPRPAGLARRKEQGHES